MRMSRVPLYFTDFMSADVDAEKLKADDHVEFEKVAKEMESIWGFHYANMPREDWVRAKELFDKAQLGVDGELN